MVNALSEWLEVQVHKDGKIYEMKFSRGNITQEMKIVGNTDHTGTTVTFKPDPEMFEDTGLQLRHPPHPDAGAGLPQRRAAASAPWTAAPGRSRRTTMCYEGGIREFVTWHQPEQGPPSTTT